MKPENQNTTDQVTKPERDKNETKIKIGYYCFRVWLLVLTYIYFFIEHRESMTKWSSNSQFWLLIGMFIWIALLFDFKQILYDNQEYIQNKNPQELTEKIRLRAALFNNIAIILFLMILGIIAYSFYFMSNASSTAQPAQTGHESWSTQIASTVFLIFLIQILFRVFKYLLRVAAFYNARADAIEFDQFGKKLELDKSMDLFTPDKYDISELENSSVFADLIKAVKGK